MSAPTVEPEIPPTIEPRIPPINAPGAAPTPAKSAPIEPPTTAPALPPAAAPPIPPIVEPPISPSAAPFSCFESSLWIMSFTSIRVGIAVRTPKTPPSLPLGIKFFALLNKPFSATSSTVSRFGVLRGLVRSGSISLFGFDSLVFCSVFSLFCFGLDSLV